MLHQGSGWRLVGPDPISPGRRRAVSQWQRRAVLFPLFTRGVEKNELFKRDPPLPLEGGVKGSRGREAPPGPEAREATASRPSARVLFQRGRRSGPPLSLRRASFFPSPGRARGALPGEEKPPRRGTA